MYEGILYILQALIRTDHYPDISSGIISEYIVNEDLKLKEVGIWLNILKKYIWVHWDHIKPNQIESIVNFLMTLDTQRLSNLDY